MCDTPSKMVLIAVAIAASGCAAQQIESGMNSALGHSVTEVIAAIGYPDAEGMVAGKKVYVWRTDFDQTVVFPQTDYTTGTVGSASVSLQSTQFVPTTAHFACQIRAIVDGRGIVEAWDSRGNQGGCASYGRRLAGLGANPSIDTPSDWIKGYQRGIKSGPDVQCGEVPPSAMDKSSWMAGCSAGRKDKNSPM